jgi:aspartyl-tRNA(Asn)/glutamyl-tRNA(Gln) amidotransferase subunit C
MDKELITKLASLSRLDLDEQETEKMSNDIGAILNYVDQVKNAVSEIGDLELESADIRNVTREDIDLNDAGFYTENILNAAPETQDKQIKVKKIL